MSSANLNEETERERKARREREKGPEREGDSGGEEDGKKKKEKACGAVMKGKREKTKLLAPKRRTLLVLPCKYLYDGLHGKKSDQN